MNKPFLLKLLIFFVLFQAISGIGGGIALILSPTGEAIGLPISMLENTPFSTFLIPGIFLFVILGIFPLLLGYAMIKEPKWNWTNKLNIYENFHYLWAYSLCLGLILVSWIIIQVYLVGGENILQLIYGLLGVLIIMITLSPQVIKYYSLKND